MPQGPHGAPGGGGPPGGGPPGGGPPGGLSLKIPLQIDNPSMPKEQMMGLNSRKRSRYPTYPNGMVMAILYWIGLTS